MLAPTTTNGRNRSRPYVPRNRQHPDRPARPASHQHSQLKQKYDHYCALAQATNGDDDVTRQQHWQHAEHFLRMMNGSAT